jgi:hypothetical protein
MATVRELLEARGFAVADLPADIVDVPTQEPSNGNAQDTVRMTPAQLQEVRLQALTKARAAKAAKATAAKAAGAAVIPQKAPKGSAHPTLPVAPGQTTLTLFVDKASKSGKTVKYLTPKGSGVFASVYLDARFATEQTVRVIL